MARVLIIDDDKLICDWIANVLAELGHSSFYAHTLEAGLRKTQSEPFDIVFVAVRLPDGSGLDIIPKIKAARSFPEIIMITGLGDPDEAEFAIKSGVWDYLEKPASVNAIKLPVIHALEYRAERMTGKPTMVLKREAIIGNSQKLNSCLELVAQAASNDANVLISGETGTGKELFAKVIHYNSPRAKRNFVIVDCTALPETLVESVLFGHARGAFTGAVTSEEGLIKQADGGTLFLDEIGELPSSIQKKFLRVIQEHSFRPVGGRQETTSDFRLVAATNRDLEDMVPRGRFREDLLFRLRTLLIEAPPLREILEDIQELTKYYTSDLCARLRFKPKGFSPEFWNVVTEYPWPGNVRELIRALEKALISAQDEPMLFPKHLPTYIRIQVARSSFSKKPAGHGKPEIHSSVPKVPRKLKEIRKAAVSEAERQYLKDLISFAGGDNNKACRISGLSRSRFYTLLRKYRPLDGR
ncbi:MAG: sigma-54 dependent transcriptional regulator [Candidatus Aminicenantales bacterium]